MQTYEIVRKRVEMYLFLRRIFPLWSNSKLKKNSGFNQPNVSKNFFGFLPPGDLGHLLCLRRSQSERVARAKEKSNDIDSDFQSCSNGTRLTVRLELSAMQECVCTIN